MIERKRRAPEEQDVYSLISLMDCAPAERKVLCHEQLHAAPDEAG